MGMQIGIPTLVRIKPGALARVGIYLARTGLARPWLMWSAGLPAHIGTTLRTGLAHAEIEVAREHEVDDPSFERTAELLDDVPSGCGAIVGVGGGKTLDLAKYVAHLAGLPYVAVPTSLSNDGFASPTASLTLRGRRRSWPAKMPFGVVVDTEVAHGAPLALWHSGVGDLVAKLTAVVDWKLAFHAMGTPVDDFAALLSDATVHQFLARPARDLEGVRLLATALMLNGVAIGVAGSSRPASGSEHLISHALDATSARPRLHGLQVGVAALLCAKLQGRGDDAPIEGLFEATGFWASIERDPFVRTEWQAALQKAPSMKDRFYTVLSEPGAVERGRRLLNVPPLSRCFM
ncbi:MAG: iron-containing alcohol dehydrogenase family protein [Myxococcota bacterium]